MSRFLFAVPPLAGHVNPTTALGAELERRGHDVAWVGHPQAVAPLLPTGARLFPAGARLTPAMLEEIHARWLNLRALAALKVLWEEVLIPLGLAMVDGVASAVDGFGPDVTVVDQQTLAGAAVARRDGLVWATSASTFSELSRPYAGMPRVEAWAEELLAGFSAQCGLSPDQIRAGDLRFSEHLVLAFTTPELAGDAQVACNPVFVGPAIGSRPAQPGFDWAWLDAGPAATRRRRILVSLGTHNGAAGARLYRVVLEAAAALRSQVQVILAVPAAQLGSGMDVPDNVLAAGAVPQLELLPHLDAVLCHGGHNTVSESLACGLPLVVAPIRDDQPLIAERVVAAGAGIRVRFGRVQAPDLVGAIQSVLNDQSYRHGAARIASAFTTAGGARAAADHLEKLL